MHFFFNNEALFLALGIIGAALLSEDASTITAATLTASSMLNAKLAFASAFAGLWLGDLGVYAMARYAGHSIRGQKWFSKKMTAKQTEPSETEAWGLALSRFFPGTRMPAYVSAGLNKMPFHRFGGITAASALVWTAAIFLLIELVPMSAMHLKRGLPYFAVVGLGLYGLLLLWRFRGKSIRVWMRRKYELATRWEFWPPWLFYAPVALIYTGIGIRYRGFSLPAVANLNQKNGGIIGESKIEILRELMKSSPDVTADGYLIPVGEKSIRTSRVLDICKIRGIGLPFVLKPDTAQRGAGFKKIQSFDQLEPYFSRVKSPVVLQRYVSHPYEAGVFYYRFPQQQRGEILGITRKVFPTITGDAVHTLRELIELDPRAHVISATYLKRFSAEADHVLEMGERFRLVEAGNHCQGCEFRDGADLQTEALRAAFDEISQKLPGFYVGRFDVRYTSDEDLRAGKDFQILELNGAASEATNIYDSQNSIWTAYSTLFRQWRIVFAIGAENRRRGFTPPSPLALWRDWKNFTAEACEYPIAD